MGSYASINNREALVAFCAAADGVIGLPDGAAEGTSSRRGRGGGLRGALVLAVEGHIAYKRSGREGFLGGRLPFAALSDCRQFGSVTCGDLRGVSRTGVWASESGAHRCRISV